MTYCDRECEQADGKFFCEKHGVWKNQKLAEACQLSDELRWMWENNCGPGQTPDGNPATAATKKTRKKCKGCGGNAFRLGWTFVKAQAKFAADGFQCVDQAEYDRRRAICEACEHLTGTRCGVCGCFVSLKAAGRVWTCDEGKWGTPPQ